MRSVVVNGQPGAVLLDGEGRAVVVVALDIADDLVQSVRAISNPEKLRHLDVFIDAPRLSPHSGSPT
jgi:RNA polymerase sigma-70 factor (ECF subfamily)